MTKLKTTAVGILVWLAAFAFAFVAIVHPLYALLTLIAAASVVQAAVAVALWLVCRGVNLHLMWVQIKALYARAAAAPQKPWGI